MVSGGFSVAFRGILFSLFHDIPRHSKTYHNIPRHSRTFQDIPWKLQVGSVIPQENKSSQERTQGPIRYNVATGKLTFGDYHYKPDAEGK